MMNMKLPEVVTPPSIYRIPIPYGLGPNLSSLSSYTFDNLTSISHGGSNKVGERVIRNFWCNLLGDIIILVISRFIILRKLHYI